MKFNVTQDFSMTAAVTVEFACPNNYDLYMTCHAHGWKNLAPFSWDDETGTLHFSAILDESSLDIECCQIRSKIKSRILAHEKLSASGLDAAKKMICRCLSLEADTRPLMEKAEKIGPEYARLVRKGAGRLLRAPTLWEDAAKTLFTTNCTWALTQKMCSALCTEKFARPAPSGACPFPHPETLAAYLPDRLKELAPVGYRARYLTALAESFAKDPFLKNLESNGHDYHIADRMVRSFPGFADYGCAHLLVLAGYFEKIPVDTTVVSFLKKNHRVRKPQSFIARHYRKWGKDRWWGYKLDRMIAKQNWIGE
jgi:hypothetical protein